MLSHAFTVLSAEILFLGLDQGTDSSNQMHSGRSYGYKSNKTIVMAEFDSKIFEATKTWMAKTILEHIKCELRLLLNFYTLNYFAGTLETQV